MSRRPPRDTRTVSDYHPSHHKPAASLAASTITMALAVAVVTVVSYPVLSLVAATAVVGVVAVVRVVLARIERTSMKVAVPGLPVEVTVATTTGD